MAPHSFQVQIGDQVYLDEGGEEIGAVRSVARDHLVVYIENAGEFIVPGPSVKAAHDGKVVLDVSKSDAHLLTAARKAHVRETE